MSHRVPESRVPAIEEVLSALRAGQHIVLTTHINADGDGAGSQVALASWLKAQGKKVHIVNPTAFPRSLGSLLPDSGWASTQGSRSAHEALRKADLAVVLDTGEASRVGSVYPHLESLPRVVVDHHPPGDEPISGVSLVDPEACATGELVFDLLVHAGGPWLPEIVTGLYVALLSDTGSFRFSNTTPTTHRIAAELVERGAEPEELYRLVYGNFPLRKLRLLQAALGELKVDPDGGLAWMTVPAEAYDALGARAEDIEGLVDFPRDVEGVEVGLLFRETARGGTKVSFRSNGGTDVNALARAFGGGGHVKASGAVVDRPLPEVRAEVLNAVRAALRGREMDDEG